MTTTNVLDLLAKRGVPHQLDEIHSHYKKWDEGYVRELEKSVHHNFFDCGSPITDFQVYLSEVMDDFDLACLYGLLESTRIGIRPATYEFYEIDDVAVSSAPTE